MEGAASAAGSSGGGAGQQVSEGDAKAIRDLARTLRDKRNDADLLSQEFTCSECHHSNPWKVHLSCEAAELDPVRRAWIEDEPGDADWKGYLRMAAARVQCEQCQGRTGPHVSDGVLGSAEKGCFKTPGDRLPTLATTKYQGDRHFRFKCKVACCNKAFAVRRDVRPEEDNEKSRYRTFDQRFGHQWTEHNKAHKKAQSGAAASGASGPPPEVQRSIPAWEHDPERQWCWDCPADLADALRHTLDYPARMMNGTQHVFDLPLETKRLLDEAQEQLTMAEADAKAAKESAAEERTAAFVEAAERAAADEKKCRRKEKRAKAAHEAAEYDAQAVSYLRSLFLPGLPMSFLDKVNAVSAALDYDERLFPEKITDESVLSGMRELQAKLAERMPPAEAPAPVADALDEHIKKGYCKALSSDGPAGSAADAPPAAPPTAPPSERLDELMGQCSAREIQDAALRHLERRVQMQDMQGGMTSTAYEFTVRKLIAALDKDLDDASLLPSLHALRAKLVERLPAPPVKLAERLPPAEAPAPATDALDVDPRQPKRRRLDPDAPEASSVDGGPSAFDPEGYDDEDDDDDEANWQ